MQKPKTYFEQVPLEVVNKIVEEQSEEEESAEPVPGRKKGTMDVVKPKGHAS